MVWPKNELWSIISQFYKNFKKYYWIKRIKGAVVYYWEGVGQLKNYNASSRHNKDFILWWEDHRSFTKDICEIYIEKLPPERKKKLRPVSSDEKQSMISEVKEAV